VPLDGPPGEQGIVLIECPAKAERRPYHQQKLALLLANLRHFALEQARRGVLVRHIVARSYAEGVARAAGDVGPMRVAEPAERELRVELEPLVTAGTLLVSPHRGWLTTPADFAAAQRRPAAGQGWTMEPFYRHVRRTTGLLMQGGEPEGGAFNFDAENRRAWRPDRGDPEAPTPPRFEPDTVTREVIDLVQGRFGHHPGRVDAESLPASLDDAERLWAWAMTSCVPLFGPFEDAMSTRSRGLFHTRVSSLLNLHRLLPSRVVADVAACDAPIASREGFVRQVLGWREFVRHVHYETDGFRRAPAPDAPELASPGDGGWQRWSRRPWPRIADGTPGGAAPSALDAHRPVPPAFWGRPSGMACLDRTVGDVWETGYGHHITRLMVLSNLGTLLGVSPRELTDWFWAAYTDAYDWVVEPNVLGMGTWAVGGLMTTKPYVCGGAYIHRMSDFCASCPAGPPPSCPVTALYWAFIERHEPRLRRNARTAGAIAGLSRRTPEQRESDRLTAARWMSALYDDEGVTEPGPSQGSG
jgi:deoxyribodipyrimidine photolyase-related protein